MFFRGRLYLLNISYLLFFLGVGFPYRIFCILFRSLILPLTSLEHCEF